MRFKASRQLNPVCMGELVCTRGSCTVLKWERRVKLLEQWIESVKYNYMKVSDTV
jgi:hypothetical protein